MCRIFFFQAEDGIRDLTVTGVQTCALPIWHGRVPQPVFRLVARPGQFDGGGSGRIRHDGEAQRPGAGIEARSEERRGGEEGRSRWAPDHLKKKKNSSCKQVTMT